MSSLNTNVAAMTALLTLTQTNKSLTETQARISTGLRVENASDNAAYWSIATTMRSDNMALAAVEDALGFGAAKTDTAYTGLEAAVEVVWVDAERIEREGLAGHVAGLDGILVPGGFGDRGIEGKIQAIRHAREQRVPYFGICLGMQCAVIEYARHVCGLEGANSTEFDPTPAHNVIDLLPEQRHVQDKGGTMRLGLYPVLLSEGTAASRAYGQGLIEERHRHRYEVNNDYLARLEKNGLRISGIWAEKQLVEIIELPDHPWFVAGQFHPEFLSRPWEPHPLFAAFIKAALDHQGGV